MRRYDIPVTPTIVGMILAPLAEQQLGRALDISQSDISIFLTKPISATVLAITAALLIGPPVWKFFAKRRALPGHRTPITNA